MLKIYLIRHGQTDWNLSGQLQGQSDIALTELGQQQAQLLAEHFPAEKLDAIFSSDLQRAHDTAKALAKKFSCEIFLEKNMREIFFGDWEGLRFDEIIARWGKEFTHQLFSAPGDLSVPNGETFAQLSVRAMKALEIVREKFPEGHVAMVAHGAFNKTLLATILHIPLNELWHIRQDNTAVNIFRFDGDYFSLELLNDTHHLQGMPKAKNFLDK